MFNRPKKIMRFGVVAAALATLPLAGCSAGSSSFGNNKLQIAELAPTEAHTPDTALIKARSHFRNNDFGYAAAYYKKLVEMEPKNPEGYIGLSASYDRLARFDLSDRVYSAMFKITGGTAQYYNNLGYSHMLRGNLKGAFTNFRHAERLAPDSVVVANNIMLLSDAVNAARA